MALPVDVGSLINLVSGLFLVALGAMVAMLRPRRRVNGAFALFSIVVGYAFSAGVLALPTGPLADAGPLQRVLWSSSSAARLVAAVALAYVAACFPRPLGAAGRPFLQAPLAIGSAYAVATLAILTLRLDDFIGAGVATFGVDPSHRAWILADLYSIALLQASLWFALFLLAARCRNAPPDAHVARSQASLMSAGLILYPGFVVGAGYASGTSPLAMSAGPLAIGAIGMAAALGLCVVWLRAAATDAAPARSRNLALLCLLTPLAGAMWYVMGFIGGYGVARTAGVAVLGYAIVRHQLLGIDVRIRWTIRQSTVAAIFIAVFFVVSELATAFLSGRVGTVLGILAAGGLVFAIAPLQRVAERFANAAMPGVKPVGDMTASERRQIFLDQVRGAWADGALSKDEREMLERLRQGLGLSVEEAYLLEREAAGQLPS